MAGRRETLEKWRRWKRRRPDWPLSVAANGQWTKKVRGRHHYFGLLDEPDGAMAMWNQQKDCLLAGEEPLTDNRGGYTVRKLCEEHYATCEARIARGAMSSWSLKDYRVIRRFLQAAGVEPLPIGRLTPRHWATVLHEIESSGLRLRSQRNIIMAIKTLFNWGSKMDLCKPINFGPGFTGPSTAQIEAEREAKGALRFFDRELLLGTIQKATPRMKVVILLGVNCGFYTQDTTEIPIDRLHLDHDLPHHDFRRVKTLRRRMAVLWPETVTAIREYMETRSPEDSAERRLMLTRVGRPYSSPSASRTLPNAFASLVESVGERPKGASLGSLRHTYATVAGLSADQPMIDLTMGHVAGTVDGSRRKSLQRRIYSQFNLAELDRLKAISEIVRQWLYHGEIKGVEQR